MHICTRNPNIIENNSHQHLTNILCSCKVHFLLLCLLEAIFGYSSNRLQESVPISISSVSKYPGPTMLLESLHEEFVEIGYKISKILIECTTGFDLHRSLLRVVEWQLNLVSRDLWISKFPINTEISVFKWTYVIRKYIALYLFLAL